MAKWETIPGEERPWLRTWLGQMGEGPDPVGIGGRGFTEVDLSPEAREQMRDTLGELLCDAEVTDVLGCDYIVPRILDTLFGEET